MEFYTLLDQVVALLRSRGRVSYRALKLQFNLHDEAVAALKDELIAAQQLAVDEQGTVLVWTGETTAAIALYRAMDMTFWLPQAEAALAQVRAGETNSSA